MPNNKNRPRFLNLARIRFPVTAVLSVGHRASGILLFLLLPAFLFAFETSLESPEGYARVAGWLSGAPARAAAVVAVWALAHHLFAGVRFLLIDLDLFVERGPARATAWGVHAAAFAAMLGAAWGLFG